MTDKSLEHIRHVMLARIDIIRYPQIRALQSPVVLPADLHGPGVGPELGEEPVDVDVAARLPVDALGHHAVAVHELDALVHDDGHVLVCDLLVSQNVAVVEGDCLDVFLPRA